MTNHRLKWQSLLPNTSYYHAIFADAARLEPVTFSDVQPRLDNALNVFLHPQSPSPFLLLKTTETVEHLALITKAITQLKSPATIKGHRYIIGEDQIHIENAINNNDPFSAGGACLYREWIEPEQLFGCVRIFNNKVTLHPGVIHQVNGGVLVLSANTLLTQPLLWFRLKQILIQKQYQWLSFDNTRPLPVDIPSMPLDLRLVIVGSRSCLAEFCDFDPSLNEKAVYGEFEDTLSLTHPDNMITWCKYVNTVCSEQQLPALDANAWPALVIQAVRYTEDQAVLPLSPAWIKTQISEAALYSQQGIISADALNTALRTKEWRENYLAERMLNEIKTDQIIIETEGAIIGQINALSVLDYPGHPRSIGEPSRISCVVHFGDGELTDIERKAELAGNHHAKGMMIMQAFLMSELDLEQQLPFSASVVFEQSYDEIDGDSASLAELCVLISALSQQPITQHIAVTGSVDQFGHVQSIGGINEKIEGFFSVCHHRGLTGKQGVILPIRNMRHLCLHADVVNAVRDGHFHLWGVNHVSEALLLLTGVPYTDEHQPSLMASIQERIAYALSHESCHWPWFLRWLNKRSHN